MKILVTGGAGYIGSHVVRVLNQKNYEVIILDNLSTGHIESVPPFAVFEKADLLETKAIESILKKHQPEAVIHFAAFALVGESVEDPQKYYLNNVSGALNLLNAIKKYKIKNFVFSSTCSIYGNPDAVPISEKEQDKPINPYGKTKLIIENALKDYDSAYGIKSVALRYFNAAGAASSGEIGESHNPETHLIPLVLKTALGEREEIKIYGNDYPTTDGTCIRDYIHVDDLANAHVKALEYLIVGNESVMLNLGTGKGNSVLDIIETAERITGKKIKKKIALRREGDPSVLVADNKKAKQLLNWQPYYEIEKIIETAWKWHQNQKY